MPTGCMRAVLPLPPDRAKCSAEFSRNHCWGDSVHLERSAEQRMLLESATRFLRSRGRSAQWSELAELGWIAAALSEDEGGLGGRAADVIPICEAIGATGTAVPYFSSVLLPAGVLAHTPPFDGPQELLQRFLDGESRLAVAHSERSVNFACDE